MKTSLSFAMFASILSWGTFPANATGSLQAISVEHYTGRCIDTANNADSDTNCEVSGVARIDQRLFFANDKPIQGRSTSSLFSIPLPTSENITQLPLDFEQLSYAQGELIGATEKLEGLTQVTIADKLYGIATPAFSKAAIPASNQILYWPVDRPEEAKVLGKSDTIRKQMATLVGQPFFQVEGIAVAPGNWLLLGVRKIGENSKTATPEFIILRAPLAMKNNEVALAGDFEHAYRFKPQVPGDSRPLSLSGLEYDPYNARLLATTSFEQGEEIGGYLWTLPLSLLTPEGTGAPQPILGPDGAPLWFDNKPEGVEVLNKTQVLIVHDDDRVQVATTANGKAKQRNEFTYSVIELRAP